MGSFLTYIWTPDESSTVYDSPLIRRSILSGRKPIPSSVDTVEEYIAMPDGHILFSRCYISSNVTKKIRNPRGMICYNHGYCDHIDNMVHFVGIEWAKRGFIFFAHEHFGHGRSDGLHVYCPEFNLYARHSSYIHNYAKCKYSRLYKIPDNAFFLAGESLGGAISIHEVIYESRLLTNNTESTTGTSDTPDGGRISSETVRLSDVIKGKFPLLPKDGLAIIEEKEWSGLILAAPMCMVDKTIRPPWWVEIILRYFIVHIFPKLKYAPLGDMDPWLLSDEASLETRNEVFKRNKLRWGNGKARFITAKENLDAGIFIEQHAKEMTLPVILVHSITDRVTNATAAQKFVQISASPDKEIRIYEKGYHLIWHDCVGNEVYRDVENWIEKKITDDIGSGKKQGMHSRMREQ